MLIEIKYIGDETILEPSKPSITIINTSQIVRVMKHTYHVDDMKFECKRMKFADGSVLYIETPECERIINEERKRYEKEN